MNDSTIPGERARRADDRQGAVRLWCRRHAARTREQAMRIAPLRLAGQSHEQARLQVGLTVEQYRRAKRWLNDAIALSAGSPDALSLEDAITIIADRHVETVLRLGLLRAQGQTRQQIRKTLELSDDQYEIADEWRRDALAAVSEREHD